MQNVEDQLTAVLANGRNVHAYAMQCSNGGLRTIVSLGGGSELLIHLLRMYSRKRNRRDIESIIIIIIIVIIIIGAIVPD